MVDQPHAFFLKTEGPDRDPTWLQTLPSEAHRLFMKQIGDTSNGFYKLETTGILVAVGGDKFNWEKFNKSARVSTRFTTPFSIASESLVSKPAFASDLPETPAAENVDDGAKAPAASAGQETDSLNPQKDRFGKLLSDGKGKEAATEAFRKQCEQKCTEELDARTVAILAEGAYTEIKASLTMTRLYQNFLLRREER